MGKYFGRKLGRKRRSINDYIAKFEKKNSDLKQMNREVIILLDEEELENDAIQCEEIEYNRRTIPKILKELQSIKINDNLSNVNNTICVTPVKA